MKSHWKNLFGSLNEVNLELDGSSQPSARRMRLHIWKLEDKDERFAFDRLSSGVRKKREFERLVLASLYLIAKQASLATSENESKASSAKLSRTKRALTRRAQSVRNFARKLKKPRKKLGIPPATTHAFRHGRVSFLQKNRVPEDMIKTWIGHSSLKITSGYTHFSQEDEREVIENLDD